MAASTLDGVAAGLTDFIKAHKTSFDAISTRNSQLLELAALTLNVQHYACKGYAIEPRHLIGGAFRVKRSAAGKPWNFSWFAATRAGVEVAIHANLPVKGSYGEDGAIYVVDVGVVHGGSVPDNADVSWVATPNKSLLSFTEAKALVVYPMLVAQFIGIVHELMPRLLGRAYPARLRADDHHFPALVTLGYMTERTRGICDAFPARRYWITVVPNFGSRFIARPLSQGDPSPFEGATMEWPSP